ncbi:DNA gyrase subunit A [Candidatus Kinetoplastibacterium sorsogonicusi]|uniref:DNA gyrase subunit A n=1 Tax=Candidatus Kinetoplastidibacterium kentomonadis TaxID=1576550 RepID=A0A3Q8EY93_9PROT|nr:DNA gyrase subunit A [Candidatus Kinetoplastibacterium sorsogonicusi]AWD32531.1 DNA gyrase subunit A [Candidatus Kinetoplastibacterium sorsogonicusi]
MNSFAKETLPITIEEEMRRSYLDYAMSVIVGRALPDVRDGLKPVHRRVLFAMNELNNDWNKPYKKSARIVGDVIGKYHPHGDQSVYAAIVRMAQTFSMRNTLINGQGNFGSIDGDSAAAMRYTEIRLSKIAHHILADIDFNTVDFIENYDGSEYEPVLLPSKIPNLLLNGSSGIAVGMATSIPTHNLGEVIDGCIHCLHNPECSIEDLMEFIPAPDFPTGGIIYGISGIKEGYRTGRGRVIMRAETHFEKSNKDNKYSIVVDSLPYQVNKKTLQERIAELVNEHKIEGISDIRDESDKDGMRLVIELKRGEIPDIILNNLYKYTQLQDSLGINLVALVDGQPKLLNLKEIIVYFLKHRKEVVTRRTMFLLNKTKEKAHILEGLAVAVENIDEFISIIKYSSNSNDAKRDLMNKLWKSSIVSKMIVDHKIINNYQTDINNEIGLINDCYYKISEIQVQEILNMRLQRLTGLEREKIFHEYNSVISEILDFEDILNDNNRIINIIDKELNQIKKEFYSDINDFRKSKIEFNAYELETEDFIKPKDMVVTLSHYGYIKSQLLSEYRSQKRGGHGKQATSTKEDDWIDHILIANTHDFLLCFSNKGRVYWLKVWEIIPQGSRNSKGKPLINILNLSENEKITTILPIKEFSTNKYIFMATARGIVKKTPLSEFSNPRKKGIIAVSLDLDDYLIGVDITDGNNDIMLFSDAGKAVRFKESDVRHVGRNARGVRGMLLNKQQKIVSLIVSNNENCSILTVTENGFGKRTSISEYTRHGRGTKGMIAIHSSLRNGKLVGAIAVNYIDEIMLITNSGILVRTRVSEIREMGRSTQGVTLINVNKSDVLSAVKRVVEHEGNINKND